MSHGPVWCSGYHWRLSPAQPGFESQHRNNFSAYSMGNYVSSSQVKPVETPKVEKPIIKPKKSYRKFKDFSSNKVDGFVFL